MHRPEILHLWSSPKGGGKKGIQYRWGDVPLGIHFPRKSHEGYRALPSPETRKVSASSPKPVECFLSHRLPLHSHPQTSRDSLSSTHPRFPQSRKETSSDHLSLQVDARDCWCPSRRNVKVMVFFISQQNKFQRINFSVALALGITDFTLFTENRQVILHISVRD